jgi:hypothetical protein
MLRMGLARTAVIHVQCRPGAQGTAMHCRHVPASTGDTPWKHLQVAGAVQTPLDEQLPAHRGAAPGSDHRACSDTRAFSCRYTSLLYTAMYILQRNDGSSQLDHSCTSALVSMLGVWDNDSHLCCRQER